MICAFVKVSTGQCPARGQPAPHAVCGTRCAGQCRSYPVCMYRVIKLTSSPCRYCCIERGGGDGGRGCSGSLPASRRPPALRRRATPRETVRRRAASSAYKRTRSQLTQTTIISLMKIVANSLFLASDRFSPRYLLSIDT